MISISNLGVQFSGIPLFEGVSFIINPRDRIGLTGRNGAGKTTLLRILAGQMEPQEGIVSRPKEMTLGFLEQEIIPAARLSVREEANKAFEEALHLEKELHRITSEITGRDDFHSSSYMKLISQLHEMNDRYHFIGGHTREADTERVLQGLGFEIHEFDRPLRTFSGGWQMRVELAKILLRKPDLLLLDEPTNHLDIESIQWLEGFLESYEGAVILVSHDRTFLDNVTNRTLEISLGKAFDYKCSYSEYVLRREEERSRQMAAFSNQQREIAQIERFVERFRYKNTKARQVQSRVKLLEKMDRIVPEDVDKAAIHFQFPPAPHSGKVVVEAQSLGKSFGSKQVLRDLSFSILKNEFVAFVGKNGMGKTTLSRIIVGDLDHSGQLKLGHNVKLGYFAQNQAELLDPEKTVFQTIDDVATGEMRPRVRKLLGSFLFSGETIDKKVKVLSGGEKSRLALARLLLTPVNLLILDEPTNHLDMQSKDILKNALLQFGGALIVVSHDRDFLQGLTTKVFEFRSLVVKEYLGDIFDFLESRKLQSLADLERNATTDSKSDQQGASGNKLSYEKKKQQDRELRKIAGQIQRVEENIASLEAEVAGLDRMLQSPQDYPELSKQPDIFTRYEKLKKDLEAEMESWSVLHTLYEDFQKEQGRS